MFDNSLSLLLGALPRVVYQAGERVWLQIVRFHPALSMVWLQLFGAKLWLNGQFANWIPSRRRTDLLARRNSEQQRPQSFSEVGPEIQVVDEPPQFFSSIKGDYETKEQSQWVMCREGKGGK
jgi:hypothetical protein